jgi:hypothetical protein
MSSDFLNSANTTAFPSTASSAVSSPKIRQRSGFTLSPESGSLSLPSDGSKISDKKHPNGDGYRPRGSLSRNVIEGLQLDKLGERISKLPRMEMPDLKLTTPNLDVDVQ